MKNLKIGDRLITDLKTCILDNKPKRILIAEAAHQLNTCSRTLQRKLQQRGTTYKKIEYQLILKLAKTYLEEKHRSIDEISYLLGFSECSAFTRFFKSQESRTPKEYQNSNQAADRLQAIN